MARRRKYKIIEPTIIGETEDGFSVLNGEYIFLQYDSHGIPLTIILDVLSEQKIVVDWIGFYKAGLKQNWNDATLLLRIKESITDTMGKEAANYIIKTLVYWRSKNKNNTI